MSERAVDEARVAEILAAAQAGTAPPPVSRGPRVPRVRTVDFSKPSRFTAIQQRRLERAVESFCRTSTTPLSAEMKTQVDLESLGSTQLTWSDAHGRIDGTATCAVLARDGGDRALLLALERPMLRAAIELLLGGEPAALAGDREFTEIDAAVVRRLLETIVARLSDAWEEAGAGRLGVRAVDQKIETARVVAAGEPTLAMRFEIRLGDLSSTASLLVPYLAVGDGFAADPLSARSRDEDRSAAALLRVPVRVRAEAGPRSMRLDDLLDLEVGDVVALEADQADGVRLSVDRVPVGRALPDAAGARRAVRIVAVGGQR